MKGVIIIMINVSIFFCMFGCMGAESNDKSPKNTQNKQARFDALRQNMVSTQIESRGVKNASVLNAMMKVPRHLFVPPSEIDRAYNDYPLPIGENQTISQPYIVALMTELLKPEKDHRVLEVGTGSGYQAAVLAEIVQQVYTIEIIDVLAKRSSALLSSMGYSNITVKSGDGYEGWAEYAPFDGIIVTAAPDHVPQPLVDQLKVGGRMVIPVGDWYQELLLIKKTDSGIKKETVIPVRFVPMTGKAQKKND